jgi:hypothetical protein
MEVKINELRHILSNKEGFDLQKFHQSENYIFVRLTKRLESGFFHIIEKHISLDYIDNEITEAKEL